MQNEKEKQALIDRIDRAIEGKRADLARDTIKLVNINSVKGDPEPGAPFGKGPRAVLDAVMEIGRADGFHVKDYGVGVVSLAMREGQPDLGIWLHGDVVQVGEGWNFPPFDAQEYKGCIIGRGATDNKGQLSAILNLLRIFQDLEIPLRYNTALYVGSDEESGMHDMFGVPGNPDARGFCNVCTPPRLSLVPDSSFPVGYGGKGRVKVKLTARQPLRGFTVAAGTAKAPGKAEAELNGEHFEAFCPPVHGAHPSAEGNAITLLMDQLLQQDLPEYDRGVLTFFRDATKDIHGAIFGIDAPSPDLGQPVLNAPTLVMTDGRPELTLNVRYTDTMTADEVIEHIRTRAEASGLTLNDPEEFIKPYVMDKSDEKVALLTRISNEVRGMEQKPYTLSGGTYAHTLPNAYAFGMNGNLRPDDFPKDRGGAHGLDEVVSLDRLQTAMRIYARAMLALNEIDW